MKGGRAVTRGEIDLAEALTILRTIGHEVGEYEHQLRIVAIVRSQLGIHAGWITDTRICDIRGRCCVFTRVKEASPVP